MSEVSLFLPDERALGELARRLAARLASPALVCLGGDLGAGKTAFVRAFLRGLGFEGPVRSPTYTLVESYSLDGLTVHHLDLYRLCEPEELEFLGFRDLMADPALVFIEWAEKGEGWLGEPDLDLSLVPEAAGRRLVVTPFSPTGERWVREIEKWIT